MDDSLIRGKGELALIQLQAVLARVQDFDHFTVDGAYMAFLHGQSNGLVLALKILFPGPGALGETAESLAKSVLGEKGCACEVDKHSQNI